MRNLLNFLAGYNNIIIFLILEGIALSLLTSENDYHNTRFVKGIMGFTTGLERSLSKTRSYFSLRETAEMLSAENASLRNSIEKSGKAVNTVFLDRKSVV